MRVTGGGYHLIGITEIIRGVDFGRSFEGTAGTVEHVTKSIRCSRAGSRRRNTVRNSIFSSISSREFKPGATLEHTLIAIIR